jgi:hypothetical protein
VQDDDASGLELAGDEAITIVAVIAKKWEV